MDFVYLIELREQVPDVAFWDITVVFCASTYERAAAFAREQGPQFCQRAGQRVAWLTIIRQPVDVDPTEDYDDELVVAEWRDGVLTGA